MKYSFVLAPYLIFILILGFPCAAHCQDENAVLEKKIISKLDSVRKGESVVADVYFSTSNEKHFLSFLKKYDQDPSVEVRTAVHLLKLKMVISSKDSVIRQQIVEDYLDDCYNSNNIIAGSALNSLNYFKEPDFTDKARKTMTDIFYKTRLNNEFIIICGTAQVRQLIPEFKKIAASFDRTKEAFFTTHGWYASLALARLGDPEKVDNIIAAIELFLDPNFRIGRLLKDAAYTRQPSCIKLLRKYLESNETLPSRARDGSGKGPPYNEFALEYLARYIDGFPVKAKGIGFPYPKEDFEIAKAFLKQLNSQ